MSIFKVPIMQFESAAGVPLRFAKAYFTYTGTTDPAPVYQDAEYLVEHTYPVVADAQGLFPPIFCDPTVGLLRLRVITETGDLAAPLIDAYPVNDEVDVDLASANTFAIVLILNGAGEVIPVGTLKWVRIPFACTIVNASILADQVGDVQVDVWKDTFANYPPTDGDSITAAAPLAIVAGTTVMDTTLTGWTKAIAEDDVLMMHVDSCTTITEISITLKVRKT